METAFANLPLWRKSLHHDARRGLVHSLQRRIAWTVTFDWRQIESDVCFMVLIFLTECMLLAACNDHATTLQVLLEVTRKIYVSRASTCTSGTATTTRATTTCATTTCATSSDVKAYATRITQTERFVTSHMSSSRLTWLLWSACCHGSGRAIETLLRANACVDSPLLMVLQMGSFARRAARKDPIDHNKPISAAIFHGHSRVLQRLVSASKSVPSSVSGSVPSSVPSSASSSKSSPALDLTRHLMDHLLQLEHDFAAFALTEDSSLIQISGSQTLTLDQERERERKREQSRVMSGKRFVRVAATLVRCKASVGLVRSTSHTRFETAESLQTPLHYAVTTVVANATTVAAARPRYAGFADRCAESTTLQLTRGLLCAKADVNLCDGYGCTPLHRAVSHGAFSHVSLLLQASANIDVFNNGGYTPLHLACYSGHSGHAGHVANASGKVELLLRSSASVHALNHRNQTALCLVLAAPGLSEVDIATDMAIVKALADYKASIDVGHMGHVERLSWSPREYLAINMHGLAASECTDHEVLAFEVHAFAAKLFGVVESDLTLDLQRGLHHLLQLGSQLDLGRELDKDT